MKLKIKRIDKSLPLPTYEIGGAGFDFICRKTVKIQPKEIKLVPTNSIIKLPKGYSIFIFSRSSTPLRKGLILANGVGVLDSFYCGDKDEIMLEFLNITNQEVTIKKGEILAQGVLIKHETVRWQEVKKMNNKGRGGYSVVLDRPNKKISVNKKGEHETHP